MGDDILFGFNYFNSLIRNRIDYTWNMGYFNNSKATIEGYELFFNYLMGDAICLNFGYTHLKTKNKDNDKRLARRPEDKVTVELVLRPTERLRVATDVSYVGIRFDDVNNNNKLKENWVVNGVVEYWILDYLSVFAKIENIFNYNNMEVLGFQWKPFTASVGAKVKFW